jgi:hypothetical protein
MPHRSDGVRAIVETRRVHAAFKTRAPRAALLSRTDQARHHERESVASRAGIPLAQKTSGRRAFRPYA